MFDQHKMDFSALMAKPIGTKVFVPDKSSVQFFRGKLGQSLYPKRKDFDLKDQKVWEYNSLQDKYLKKFFSQPEKKKRLVKLGLISQDGKVQCSVKEFNDYVDHLKQTQLKQVKKESEELKLIDLEEEEIFEEEVADVSDEDIYQAPREETVEMFDQHKKDFSSLMAKPKGTKIFVADKSSVQFFRGKLGQSLYPERKDFDLEDQKVWEYNNLQDKYLKKFFSQPEKKKRLIELGLISQDGKVQCSVKEFNDYVDHLKHMPQPEKKEKKKKKEEKKEKKKKEEKKEKKKEKKKVRKEIKELKLIDLEEEEVFKKEWDDASVEELSQTPGEEIVEMPTSKPLPSTCTEKKLMKDRKRSSFSWSHIQTLSSTREKEEETTKEDGSQTSSVWSLFKKVWKAVRRPRSAPSAI
ncbi:DNA ligase 1-like [Astyanax mexicanus]|uniref:DNA ligase 1-like n=1 Tax=Astyanax mexicanus TaxID=7994 RepID=UPI0020CAAA01|nr:DNA ligase 1-like [Astyanax mexicanus]XP_049342356.1 DNA ligase 1-like [Astyanax mexicanus]